MTPDANDYDRALDFLRTRTNYEQVDRAAASFGLRPMQSLLAALRHPERSIPVIHIAGTKGKGSVAWFLAALLRRAGLRVGRYLSPHLLRIEERIAVDGTQLSPAEFGAAVLEVAPHTEAARATFFDVLTAAAWVAFARSGVDVAVVEAGLGGRLDSTNVADWKWATALTAMGLEHTEVLGNTLDKIAREKAAIARPGVPMFSASAPGSEAGRAIAEVCLSTGAPLAVAGLDFGVTGVLADGDGLSATIHVGHRDYDGIHLPTAARYQAENLALAVAVVDNLAERGLVPGGREALTASSSGSDLRIPGRFERLGDRPPVLLDGAHTRESLEALLDSLDVAFPGRRRVVIFAASRDKDLDRLSSAFPGRADLAFATKAPTPRAAETEAVDAALRRSGIATRVAATPGDALTAAVAEAGVDGLVVVTGSLYLVAAVKEILENTK